MARKPNTELVMNLLLEKGPMTMRAIEKDLRKEHRAIRKAVDALLRDEKIKMGQPGRYETITF